MTASYRRLAVLVLGLALVLAGGHYGMRRALERRQLAPRPAGAPGGFNDGAPPPAVDLARHETLAPRDARVDASGERVGPFEGFGVSVESAPAGARVLAGGVDLGETPLTASVRCAPGQPVEVRVEKAGFRSWRRTTRCRDAALVFLDAKLAR